MQKRHQGFIPYIFHRPYADPTTLRQSLFSCVFEKCHKMFCMDLKAHFGCVNAIEFSRMGNVMTSGGDDKRVLVWNVEKLLSNIGQPESMKGEHHSNIFCLGFDNHGKKLYSGGNDEQVISHDIATGETLDVFLHNEAVYCLSIHPENDDVFASACDDGRILIYDTRQPAGEEPFCLANYTAAMHSVMYNPVEPRLVASANSKEGIALWDVRKPRSCLLRFGSGLSSHSGMSVRWNHHGDQLLALRRRMPPVLYSVSSTKVLCQFDHQGYYNSCTMKSCCFAGENDEYVMSGSDDFNVYMWKIPNTLDCDEAFVKEAHIILRGHRSIVNQTRFNSSNGLVASSGVEKVVKVWSPFSIGAHSDEEFQERSIYSHEEYVNMVLRSGHMMTHDYSQESTEEDPRMIAFFDSLVQRELEGWSDSSDSDDNQGVNNGGAMTDDARLQFYESVLRSESTNGSDSASDVHDGGDDSDPDVLSSDDSGLLRSASDSGNASSGSNSHRAVLENVALGAQEILDALDRVQRELDTLSDVEGDDSAAAAAAPAAGQNKRSISELIAQKRENIAKKIASKNRPKTLSKKTDSSSNTLSGSSLSSSSSESDLESSQDRSEVRSKSNSIKSKLKRLRHMRKDVLDSNSDSTPDDDDENPSGKSYSSKNGALDSTEPSDLTTPYATSQQTSTDTVVGGSKSTCVSDNGAFPSTSRTQALSPSEEEGPTWAKFKRFRNKLEKARRHYRRRVSQSSDEESQGNEKKKKKARHK